MRRQIRVTRPKGAPSKDSPCKRGPGDASKKRKPHLDSPSSKKARESSIIQLRFPNLLQEDEWIIAGVRRSRIYQTNLSKNLLKKYLETRELKKELARAKKEHGDLLHQFETEEQGLENKLNKLEREFSEAARDFSQAQEIVLGLARKFSELIGTDFRADVEEIYLAFQSLSAEEKARINSVLCDFVESWKPPQKNQLYALMNRVRESEADSDG